MRKSLILFLCVMIILVIFSSVSGADNKKPVTLIFHYKGGSLSTVAPYVINFTLGQYFGSFQGYEDPNGYVLELKGTMTEKGTGTKNITLSPGKYMLLATGAIKLPGKPKIPKKLKPPYNKVVNGKLVFDVGPSPFDQTVTIDLK
jgi:hypothetical protein